MRRGLPPTACLAVFVLACGTQPTATEPMADAEAPAFKMGGGNPGGGDNPGSSEYSYAFTGDVVTDPDPGTATANVGGGDADNLVLDGGATGPGSERVGFSEALLDQLDPDRDCFTQPLYDFSGGLRRDKRDVNGVRATFYFQALGTDGAGIKYALSLDGTVVDGNDDDIFPPEFEQWTTVEFTHASMVTEGKGKGQGGKACIGGAGIAASVTLEGTAP